MILHLQPSCCTVKFTDVVGSGSASDGASGGGCSDMQFFLPPQCEVYHSVARIPCCMFQFVGKFKTCDL